MAHVQIRQGDSRLSLQIVVDGVDLSKHILTDGFGLVQVGDVWGVAMVLVPDALDVDLPDAVVEAVRKSD